MFTCSKRYIDLPFAHRQHRHNGHCSLIHGHNWSFDFTFGCAERDANGFVIDFGELKWLKLWLETMFDHALVLNADDPALERLTAMLTKGWPNDEASPDQFAKITVVPNCGAEGLAEWVFKKVTDALSAATAGRVYLLSVIVYEDTKNRASYSL